jgi:membrane protease YdiL (CAAX protease family)
LLFAALHLDWRALPGLFVMGLVTGSMRVRTGNLTAGILLHSVNNAIASLLLLR